MGKYLLIDVMQVQMSLYFVTLPGYVIFWSVHSKRYSMSIIIIQGVCVLSTQ